MFLNTNDNPIKVLMKNFICYLESIANDKNNQHYENVKKNFKFNINSEMESELFTDYYDLNNINENNDITEQLTSKQQIQ